MEKRINSYLPTLQLRLKTEKLKGSLPIHWINKFSNSRIIQENHQELWGVKVDFKSSQNTWTIDATPILQHMGFYSPTENPCVIMRENLKTKSSEYIVTCQDELYIASTIPEEILLILQDKCKITIYLHGKYPHDPGGTMICQLKKYLEKLYANVTLLFNDKLPTDLQISYY